MGKKEKSKKGKGAEKTAAKTAKKAEMKHKKELSEKGEEDVEKLIENFLLMDRQKERVAEDLVGPPSQRSGCSFLASPDKDLLYLFGGSYFNGHKTTMYNELYTYNIKKNNWLRLTTPYAPPPRCSQQSVIVAQGGGQIWMFGGEFASPTQSQFYHYKDLWCYHIKETRWEKVDAKGGPSARSGHRMVTNGKDIFLFGGFHESLRNAMYYNDVYRFSIGDRQWTKIEPANQGPSPRSGVQMVMLESNKLMVYGGYSREKLGKDAEKGITYMDMWFLQEGSKTGNIGKWKWSLVKQGGCQPGPRSGMAAVSGPQPNRAYFFGGVCDREEDEETITSVCLADLYMLETDRGLWREMNLKKEIPKNTGQSIKSATESFQTELEEQQQHDEVKTDGIFTVRISSGAAVGAASCGDLKPDKDEIQDDRFWPQPRMSSCLAIKHGVLYLYGGIFETGDQQLVLRDMYAIDIYKMDDWKKIIELNEKELEWFDSDSEESEDDIDAEECNDEKGGANDEEDVGHN
ncbi:kelch domain-containing protein 4-like isoform X2 [Varroa destructor]|nr:kelch domain-containing protein 4-like isoform X2 [Varroa destructor]XP_022661961.1 kelch domain-containing protein 4-like isoform X2 [Varroa destructor]XP_022661962.1 kelch domain-containing protein 4-like isoform X2 [Varroa destructor]